MLCHVLLPCITVHVYVQSKGTVSTYYVHLRQQQLLLGFSDINDVAVDIPYKALVQDVISHNLRYLCMLRSWVSLYT